MIMTYSSEIVNIRQNTDIIVIMAVDKHKIKERIKMLFNWRDLSFEEYARRLETKTGQKISTSSLSHKLSRGSISFREVLEIADELGYDVIFQPRNNWS